MRMVTVPGRRLEWLVRLRRGRGWDVVPGRRVAAGFLAAASAKDGSAISGHRGAMGRAATAVWRRAERAGAEAATLRVPQRVAGGPRPVVVGRRAVFACVAVGGAVRRFVKRVAVKESLRRADLPVGGRDVGAGGFARSVPVRMRRMAASVPVSRMRRGAVGAVAVATMGRFSGQAGVVPPPVLARRAKAGSAASAGVAEVSGAEMLQRADGRVSSVSDGGVAADVWTVDRRFRQDGRLSLRSRSGGVDELAQAQYAGCSIGF